MAGWSTGFQHPKQMIFDPDTRFHRFYDGKDSKLQLLYRLVSRLHDNAYPELLDIALEELIDPLQSKLQKTYPEQISSLQISTRTSVLAGYLQVTVTLNNQKDLEALTNTVHQQILELKFALPSEEVKAIAVKKKTDFLKNIEKPHMFGIYNAEKLATEGIESVLQSYSKEQYEMAAKQVERLQLPGNPIVIVQHAAAMIQSSEVASKDQKKLFKNGNGMPDIIAVQNSISDLLAVHYLAMHKAKYESRYGKDAAKILHDCLEQRLTSPQNQKLSEQFGFTYTVNDNPFIPMDNIYLHPDFGYIRVEGLADDLSGAIQFLSGNMTGFSPTEEEFRNAQKKFQRTSHMMGAQPAQKIFEDTYKSIIYEPEKYPESGSSVTYESLSAFAKEYFQPVNIITSVVSPAAPEEINQLFSSFVSQMENNSTNNEEAWDYTLRSIVEPQSVEKEGGGEQSYLFWGFISQFDPKDKPALQALSLILADRIIFDIREKQGLAYRMSTGIDLVKDKALFYIRMGTRPQNVDKLLPQYPEFFNMNQLKTLDAAELEKSVNMYLGRMMFRRLSSINKAYYLAHSYYFYDDINYDSNFLKQLKKVTVDDVKEVARKYMQVKNPVQVVVR
jgi:predicted Zn-dependent peptidase